MSNFAENKSKQPMIIKEQFYKNIDNLPPTIYSGTQHKEYSNIRRNGDFCEGERERGSCFSIDLNDLYKAYLDNSKVNTNTLLNGGYVTGWMRSPSIAIMVAAGLINSDGTTVK